MTLDAKKAHLSNWYLEVCLKKHADVCEAPLHPNDYKLRHPTCLQFKSWAVHSWKWAWARFTMLHTQFPMLVAYHFTFNRISGTTFLLFETHRNRDNRSKFHPQFSLAFCRAGRPKSLIPLPHPHRLRLCQAPSPAAHKPLSVLPEPTEHGTC